MSMCGRRIPIRTIGRTVVRPYIASSPRGRNPKIRKSGNPKIRKVEKSKSENPKAEKSKSEKSKSEKPIANRRKVEHE
jgi:hypothetical protein